MFEDEEEEAGKGALNEKVDADGGLHIVSVAFSMLPTMPVGLVANQNYRREWEMKKKEPDIK